MRVTRLKLANIRAVDVAELHFQPGFNLVAGINGVGKTTVLDTLAVCFSAVIRHAKRYPRYGRFFESDDIRVDAGALQAECDLECAGKKYGYLLHRFRHHNPLQDQTQWLRKEEKTYNRPIEEFYGGIPTEGNGGGSEGQLLAVLFSTDRSVASRSGVPARRRSGQHGRRIRGCLVESGASNGPVRSLDAGEAGIEFGTTGSETDVG